VNRALGAGMLVVGAILLFMGFDARRSFASDVSRVVDGTPSDKTVWLLGGGALLLVAGAVMLFMRGRRAST
jgi:hypothetical protein